ncbi:MAG: hypothetical protein Q7U74_16000 [Saprospiraceae bacterium]|jgi:hypothetical protein|nr:hypothetical protein [Saprospiraceae bacterium]
MARPLKEKSNLTEVFAFRTTTELAAVWREKINKSELDNASEFFRRAVENNETTVIADTSCQLKKRATRIKHTMPPDIRRLLFLAAAISRNVNQIAHVLNGAALKDRINPALVEAILTELIAINKLAKDWM